MNPIHRYLSTGYQASLPKVLSQKYISKLGINLFTKYILSMHYGQALSYLCTGNMAENNTQIPYGVYILQWTNI